MCFTYYIFCLIPNQFSALLYHCKILKHFFFVFNLILNLFIPLARFLISQTKENRYCTKLLIEFQHCQKRNLIQIQRCDHMQNLSLFLTRISDNPHQPFLQRHPLCFLSKITITKTNSKTFSASSQVSNTAYSVTINYPSRETNKIFITIYHNIQATILKKNHTLLHR